MISGSQREPPHDGIILLVPDDSVNPKTPRMRINLGERGSMPSKYGQGAGRLSEALRWVSGGLNLAGAVSGILYLLLPGAGIPGTLVGWILPPAVAASCALCATRRIPGRRAFLHLAATAAGYGLLPFLLIAWSGFPRIPGFAAASRLVVLGSLALGILVSFSRREGSGEDEEVRPAAAAAGLAAGIAAFAISARFLAAPHPRTAGVLVPQCLPYWSLSFLAVAAGTVRSLGTRRPYRGTAVLLALPAAAAALLGGIPVYRTPGVLKAAERDFTRAFGGDAGVPPADSPVPSAFSLGRMFLGSGTGRTRVSLDVPYHSEVTPDGRSYTFRYDHWEPESGGPHPVLIRIHGGAWISGDKGYGNMNYVNRYLASRGYSVFDLQYGLAERGTFPFRSPTPDGIRGPFVIEDMLRHIRSFSVYLAENAADLNSDPSRVFLSGGSAGGHLALAAALAASSGYGRDHPGIGLDARLTLRGVIPFYPGIGYARSLGIPSSPELDELGPLLGPRNPPALFYQGNLDGMADPKRIRAFVRAYDDAGGGAAVLVEFPSAGHASDLNFWNPYSQVFLHYMERFLALHSR